MIIKDGDSQTHIHKRFIACLLLFDKALAVVVEIVMGGFRTLVIVLWELPSTNEENTHKNTTTLLRGLGK